MRTKLEIEGEIAKLRRQYIGEDQKSVEQWAGTDSWILAGLEAARLDAQIKCLLWALEQAGPAGQGE